MRPPLTGIRCILALWVILFRLTVPNPLTALAGAGRIPYPLFHNGLTTPACALIVLGLALGGGRLSRWLGAPLWAFQGNTRFSIYVMHVPLLIWMGFLCKSHYHQKISGLC